MPSQINRTATTRDDLPVDHTLFLTYLEKEEIRSSSVRPTTVANWIKAAMQATGIDTSNFQAHSIRSAASTKAVELGYTIQDVKKHANWRLQSNTFEDFYYKPSSQASSSTAINNSIFSSTENSITLEVFVSSTLVLETAHLINPQNGKIRNRHLEKNFVNIEKDVKPLKQLQKPTKEDWILFSN
ncbi:hypothetical protein G6F32_013632 [Rhizopus arrhizus]|nr:hypothetical protein G6F24_014300 [Rhizopus arrhizus]KAG0925228.1 hypothetical protein G6F32_013632 [Rhizopus arrhizus]